MRLTIIVPYDDAEKTALYAISEKEVDFEKNFAAATKVTLSFAATELKKYLSMILRDTEIVYGNQTDTGMYIKLRVEDDSCEKDNYSLCPEADGLEIVGAGRSGVLYGAYEFLKLQGYRWFAPGEQGEIVPAQKEVLVMPSTKKDYQPDMCMGRGFDLEGTLPETDLLWYWMARNRLNYGVSRTDYTPLQRKLCIKFKHGGHILTSIVNPRRIMKSGKTLWEEHPEWYGKVEGRATDITNALHCQLCLSNEELNNFIADEIIHKVKEDWPNTDKIDIWGLDIWNNICSCPKCKELGNGSDHALHMLSRIRDRINRSDLKKTLRIGTLAYDGTATMEPPTKKIPQNLLDAGDYVTLYPITRCYRHFIDTPGCQENERYMQAIKGWNALEPAMPMMIGEYYNVSKFSDLPVLFNDTIDHDIRFYYEAGARGMTYMHFPTVNLGLRSVTQMLYAELCWNVHADKAALLQDYFKKSYEQYGDKMQTVYELAEAAWKDCSQLRIWARQDKYNSILGQLYRWDGSMPKEPLNLYGHYKDHGEVIVYCQKSVEKLQQAISIIQEIKKDILYHGYKPDKKIGNAVNPQQLIKDNKNVGFEYRIAEDMRHLIFGRDTMQLTGELVAYYDALYKGEQAEALLASIEESYFRLESYFIPTKIPHNQVGLFIPDGLTRSQLRGVIKRCFYKKR